MKNGPTACGTLSANDVYIAVSRPHDSKARFHSSWCVQCREGMASPTRAERCAVPGPLSFACTVVACNKQLTNLSEIDTPLAACGFWQRPKFNL